MKKRKYLVSVLILILILSIITITILNFSEARKTITVSLEVKDTESKIDNQTTSIEAVNENDAGYYIILPDEINGRYITKYYVEETTIITTEVTTSTESSSETSSSTVTSESTATEKTQSTEDASVEDGETTVTEDNEVTDASTTENTATGEETSSQEATSEASSETTQETTSGTSSETTQETTSGTSSETTQETTKTETQTQTSYSSKTVEKLPGEKVYLTEDEQTNKKVVLNIKYDYTTVDNETMYKKKIQFENEANEITVTGYLPEDAELQVEEIESEEIFDSVQENYENVIEINVVYDIKIISNEQEFEPEDIGQDVEVNISGLSLEGDNRVVHITEENEIQEVESEVDEENENITFKAESFSYYAVLTVKDAEVEVNIEMETPLDTWNGEIATSYSGGNGTEDSPYLIKTGAELAFLAQQVNNGKTYAGQYLKLISDIDLNNNTWTPIGTATTSFSGVFDGNGYKISNATIAVSSTESTIQAYGFFGSISGSSSNNAIIKNVDFENITISLTTNATISSNDFAYKIGIVTGAMYTYTEVQNVIVQNSQITHDSGTIRAGSYTANRQTTYYYPAIYAGGIAGNACSSSSDNTTKVTDGNYVIDNCYSDVDITINTTTSTSYQATGFNIGGIIGQISNQNNTWPTNCMYTGTITSAYSTIGPIFGAETNGTLIYTSISNISSNIWVGNTSSEVTSYYTSYTVNGTSFTGDVAQGSSAKRRNNGTTNIEYVQGVNKGLYTTDISGTILTIFNTNAKNDGNLTWIYEDGAFSFEHSLTVQVIETIDIESYEKTYKIVPTSSLTNPTYSFTWYEDETAVSATTSTTDEDTYSEYTIKPSFYNDISIQVLVSDGEETVIINFTIEKLTLYIEITYNQDTNGLTAELKGTALHYLDLENYTYQWYSEDISGKETEKLEGKTSLTLEDISSDLDYKIIATYTVDGEVSELFTVSASYEPPDRIVIFVDYSDGNNNNDGYTPETAVKTLPTAYGKLNSDSEKNTTGKNVIVIIGDYTVMDVFATQSNSTYEKNVTITGCYKGTDYAATLRMSYSGSNYNFINGDTVFEYLKFRGSTGNGTGQAYIFSQGHNITMGEQIYMENYAAASTQQGLILGNNQSAPSFTLFGGYYKYNESSLPRNNSVITIKSGAYGRIVLGGSPGTVSTNNLSNTYSYSNNFIGKESEYYNCTVNIDIENSTKESFTYDVNLLVGGCAWGSIYGNITENINSGTIGRVLGGNIGDSSESYPSSWKYPFDTFIGTTTINIAGGTIDEVYGGCLGRNMDSNNNDCEAYFYGTIEINVSGGTIKKYLYGAGAGRSYRL